MSHAMANFNQGGGIQISATNPFTPQKGNLEGVSFNVSLKEADELVFQIEELFRMAKFKRKKRKHLVP